MKLVLPARKEVVQNEFLLLLQTKCECAIYEYIKTLDGHRLPYSSWEKAKSLGVTLPEAENKLYTWVPEYSEDVRSDYAELVEVNDEYLLLDIADDNHELAPYHVFSYAWERGDHGKLLEADQDYAGYSWYSSLKRITEFSIKLLIGEKKYDLADLLGTSKLKRPDEILVEYTIVDKEGNKKVKTISTDVAFASNEIEGIWYGPETITLLITKVSEVDSSELAEILRDAFFCPNTKSALITPLK